MAAHWQALVDTPNTVYMDLLSIPIHAIISFLRSKALEAADKAYPSSGLRFLIDGGSFTFRQDYALNLTQQTGLLPKPEQSANYK